MLEEMNMQKFFLEREIPRPPGGVLGMTWFCVITGGCLKSGIDGFNL